MVCLGIGIDVLTGIRDFGMNDWLWSWRHWSRIERMLAIAAGVIVLALPLVVLL